MTKALICGISGQDGAYLARLLLQKGYEVWGTSRDAQSESAGNLRRLGVADEKLRLIFAKTYLLRSVLGLGRRRSPLPAEES